ncbi:MAG: O-antigen ligase family protein [Oscillospiraceae bacterium]|nr:O-antigen ligase family protein [Oscillospiraceae bacterium]
MNSILETIELGQILAFLFVVFMCVISFVFSMAERDAYISVFQDIFIICIPAYLVACSIRDFIKLKKYLRLSAYIILIFQTLALFVFKFTHMNKGNYDMTLAYTVLPAAIILIAALFENFKIIDLLAALISGFILLSLGTRGPLACAAMFFMLVLFMRLKKDKGKLIVFLFIFGLIGVVVYLNMDLIIEWLSDIFKSLGLSERNLSLLQLGDLFTSNSRGKILDSVKLISNKQILGVGWVNERALIRDYIAPGKSCLGCYSHNFFYDFILHFGWILGLLLLAAFFWMLIKNILCNKDENKKMVGLIFIGIGLFPLFFSKSYINWSFFYALFGFCTMSCAESCTESCTEKNRQFENQIYRSDVLI